MRLRVRPLRDPAAEDLGEVFLVASVASFLGIRAFLIATGFPKLGGGELHIAHMLWGGLFMLLAFLLLFTFLDRRVRLGAALLAGVGFGTFVDEIGKFLTADNDYFFRPAVALIYLVFLGVVLAIRTFASRRPVDSREALAAALGLVASAETDGPDADDRDKILSYLDRADAGDPLVATLRTRLAAWRTDPDDAIDRIRDGVDRGYAAFVKRPWFARALLAFILLNATLTLFAALVILSGLSAGSVGFSDLALAAAAVSRTCLLLVGVSRLPSSRLAAFTWLRRAVLVGLFVAAPFAFYRSQLGAITGLAGDLVGYGGLRFLIARETVLARQATRIRGEAVPRP
jgi:hypothetical protein